MNQKYIEMIEDLPFVANDLWYIFLVALGKKSGAWVTISSDIWRDGDDPIEIDNNKVNRIENVFKQVGLKFDSEIELTDAGIFQNVDGKLRMNYICHFYISKKQSNLDNLIEARKNKDDKKLGVALGYPRTAVDAFSANNKTFVRELDPEIIYSNLGKFTQFALSRDYWREELQVVQKWMDILADISPLTYSACCRRFNTLSPDVQKIFVEYYKTSKIE